jgi:HK97 family phage portal protein
MAIGDIIKSVFSKKPLQNKQLAQFLNTVPIFSQFGEDIYTSDIVQNCIDVIATECSKMQPQHIRTDQNGVQTRPASSINRLFKVKPNNLMTTRDFLEKVIWLLYLNYNCFIYPVYEIYKDSMGGSHKNYKGFYPLNPTQVVFEQDMSGKIYTHFYFRQGHEFTLSYDEIIHLRKKFSVNDVMGGGSNGQPDNDALVSVLETNNTVIEGLGKAIKTSLSVRGLVRLNTILNDTDQAAERERFEEAMAAGESGILAMDLKGEYTPIQSDPKIVDKDVMEYIEGKVLRWFGVSMPILTGKFTDEDYQAFFEKTLEPLLITLSQAFSAGIFSAREIDVGNSVVFYPRNMMYLSTKSKLDIIKIAGEQGLLTNDQKLLLLGYPPIGGEAGAVRTQSLNFADTNLVNEYQMARSKAPQINASGGNE